MSKHTPGPWEVMVSPSGHHFVRTKKPISPENALCTRIANCATNDTDESAEKANAHLIAAAPELLAALERAYQDAVLFLNNGDFGTHVSWDAGYIVDAIKKAKGE